MSVFSRNGNSSRSLLRRGTPRVALLALLWWALVGDAPGSWWIGVPAIAAATLLVLALTPASGSRWSAGGVLRFVPFFLRRSLAGGTDVALRALRPSMPLDPDLLDYELRLPEEPARVFMANVVSLLPGTLTVDLKGDSLRVHTLTESQGGVEDLRELEVRVADLFGLTLTPEGDSRSEEGS